MYANPAVAGDRVLIGSCAGALYALHRDDGRILWKAAVPNQMFHGDPVITDSAVIIGTDGGTADSCFGFLSAFALDSGKVLWQHPATNQTGLGCGITTDILRADETVLGVTTTDCLISLNLMDGSLRWTTGATPSLDGAYWNVSPARRDSLILFGRIHGGLEAFDVSSGQVRWRNSKFASAF